MGYPARLDKARESRKMSRAADFVELSMSSARRAETITQIAEARFVHKRIFHNGTGEFALVELRLEPLEPEAGIEYVIQPEARLIPPECAQGLEDGIYEAAKAGVINGGLVIGVKVIARNCAYHEIDSNHRTFRLAAAGAFHEAMRNAGPVMV